MKMQVVGKVVKKGKTVGYSVYSTVYNKVVFVQVGTLSGDKYLKDVVNLKHCGDDFIVLDSDSSGKELPCVHVYDNKNGEVLENRLTLLCQYKLNDVKECHLLCSDALGVLYLLRKDDLLSGYKRQLTNATIIDGVIHQKEGCKLVLPTLSVRDTQYSLARTSTSNNLMVLMSRNAQFKVKQLAGSSVYTPACIRYDAKNTH